MLGMINQHKDMKISFKCSVAHQLLLKFTKSWIVFEQHCPQYDLNMLILLSITKWFFVIARNDFDGLRQLIVRFFSLPPADLNTFCFPSQGPLYCPQVVNFSRSVKKCWCHSCQGFCKLDRYSSCLTIFLFWNQLSYFKDHVYSKSSLLKWNQRCPFWKDLLKIKLFYQRSNTRYSKYTVLWLSCILKTEIDPL
jgi:hypothetical protein